MKLNKWEFLLSMRYTTALFWNFGPLPTHLFVRKQQHGGGKNLRAVINSIKNNFL